MSRNLYREVSDRILSLLEGGVVPWVQPWSSYAIAGSPRNAVTGRPYSGINILLLWQVQQAFGYGSPMFLTYKQAAEAGGTVKKGERGHKVYFVSTFKKTDGDEERNIPFLKEYTVFHVSQCENLPARLEEKQPVPRNTEERIEDAEAFVAATGATITYGGSRACYRPSSDSIAMPAFESFKNADSYYNVMFHELAHWTGAEKRLNRSMKGRFGDEAYAGEELVAELTAAFLCAEYQFDNTTQNAAYIANWIKAIKKDERCFFNAASQASKAAEYLRDLVLASEHEPENQTAIAA